MYKAVYKCKLCREKYKKKIIDINAVSNCGESKFIIDGELIHIDELEFINIKEVHNCNNGNIGMADFCGFERMEDE